MPIDVPYQAYCVKCKQKRDINPSTLKAQERDTRRGYKYYLTGNCSECGTKVSVTTKQEIYDNIEATDPRKILR